MNDTGELIRISQEHSERIEYSTDGGKSWHIRYIKNASGEDENIETPSVLSKKTEQQEKNEKD
ncbi:MAG: hypothetical protein LBQ01_09015 [Prevotellaceae bacterium]|jgi:hypothetical protein|nr:hypothetical protein [Prevotellaceae bacterium]